MASLQIRKLPDPLYRKLRATAKREHRSVPQQAIVLLAEGLDVPLSAKENRQQVLAAIEADEERLKNFNVSNPAELIRQDRI